MRTFVGLFTREGRHFLLEDSHPPLSGTTSLLLHKALKQVVMGGLVPRNLTEAMKAPQPEKKEIKPLSPTQAQTLLETAKGDRLKALCTLLPRV